MMPRFPGLSPQSGSGFVGLDFLGVGGQPLNIGHGPNSEPRVKWNEPETPPSVVTGTEPTLSSMAASVLGSSTPDLLIVRGQAATSGGGISVGMIALLAALGVGGWFIYKKVRGQ